MLARFVTTLVPNAPFIQRYNTSKKRAFELKSWKANSCMNKAVNKLKRWLSRLERKRLTLSPRAEKVRNCAKMQNLCVIDHFWCAAGNAGFF